jgi:hypothetical protein
MGSLARNEVRAHPHDDLQGECLLFVTTWVLWYETSTSSNAGYRLCLIQGLTFPSLLNVWEVQVDDSILE